MMRIRIKSKGDPRILIKNRKELEEQMRDDYGYIFCEKCGRSRGFMFLSFHHIVFRSEAPNHPQLHCKKNLLLCCDKCHDEFHGDKSVREPFVQQRGLRKVFNKLPI